MLNAVFSNPTEVYFGKGVICELSNLLKSSQTKKILLVYGGVYLKESGLHRQIVDMIKSTGSEIIELSGVMRNPRLSTVYQGISLCKKHSVDFIVAAGGASVIDSAKAVAVGTLYEGDVWDFYSDKAKPKAALPIGVLLTIPGAGSESSIGSVLTKDDGLIKRPCNSALMRPKWALMDPEWTTSLSPYFTAAGCVDAFTHCLERYFTNDKDVYLTDRMLEAVMETFVKYAPLALRDPANYETRAQIMWASKVAHDDSLSFGRTADWASHMIQHELSGLYDVAHGAGLAVIFPAWMKYVYKHDVRRFAQYANRVFGVPMDMDENGMAQEGIAQTEAFFKRLGMPVTLRELGTGDERIQEMAQRCCAPPNIKRGKFVELDEKDVLNIYKLAR